ncbi:MAG: DUF342 domain-containing protein [Desulfosporosinus sp.]
MLLTPSQAIWDGTKYIIVLGKGVKKFCPFRMAGEVWLNGKLQDKPFPISSEDQVEYYPDVQKGLLTWELQVRFSGLSVVAIVRHELPGRYVLSSELPVTEEIDLAKVVTWESLPPMGEMWDERRLNADLEQLKIVHGRRPEIWSEIMAVRGVGEVVIAVATPPVPPENPKIIDYVGTKQSFTETEENTVDFFASKVLIVHEGAVLAVKIPGKPGVPGKDVFGSVIPVTPVKDFEFRLKKNVHLSDDGLKVLASCAGKPVRIDEKTYMVEDIYLHNDDVNLETGSIEFPGDVFISGDVKDGLRVIAGGKLEVGGSVSHAEIRAEKETTIYQNLLGGKVIIGEKFVVRSKLLRDVSELSNQLNLCLRSTANMLKVSGTTNHKPEHCLKIVIEKQFSELPKLSKRVKNFVLEHNNDELVTENLIASIQIAEHYLVGLGPLEPQALPSLLWVNQELSKFVENIALEIPDKLNFRVGYVQGATVECSGSMECIKGVYNAYIRAEGDVTIENVCRGGKVISGGIVRIRELGGKGIGSTFVQIRPEGRIFVDYCYPNTIIAVGKKVVSIDEACRKLEVYLENGRVQVDKLRADY